MQNYFFDLAAEHSLVKNISIIFQLYFREMLWNDLVLRALETKISGSLDMQISLDLKYVILGLKQRIYIPHWREISIQQKNVNWNNEKEYIVH